MAKGAVGTAEREGVGESGDPDAEVGCYAGGGGPEVVEGGAVCDEGEAREPGGVEACCTYDDVDVVFFAFMIYKPRFCDRSNGISEDRCVVGDECFEIPWCRRGSSTPRIEILWDHFLDEAGVVVEFVAHLRVGIGAGELGFGAAFYDELEALV